MTTLRFGSGAPTRQPAILPDVVLIPAEQLSVAWPPVGLPVALSPLEMAALSLLDGLVSRSMLGDDLVRAGVCSGTESWTFTGGLEVRLRGARLIVEGAAPIEPEGDTGPRPEPHSAGDIGDEGSVEEESVAPRWPGEERLVLTLAEGCVELVFVGLSPPGWLTSAATSPERCGREPAVGRVRIRGCRSGTKAWVTAGDSSWLADTTDGVAWAEVLAEALGVVVADRLSSSTALKVIQASVLTLSGAPAGEPRALIAPPQPLLASREDVLRACGIHHRNSTAMLVEEGAEAVWLPEGRRLMQLANRREPDSLAEVLVRHRVDAVAVAGPLGSPSPDLVVPALERPADGSGGWTTSRRPAFSGSDPRGLHGWVSGVLGTGNGGRPAAPATAVRGGVVRTRPGPYRSRFLSTFGPVLGSGPGLMSVKVRPGEVLEEREIYAMDPSKLPALPEVLRRALGEGPVGRSLTELLVASIRGTEEVLFGFEGEVAGFGLKVYVSDPGGDDKSRWRADWDRWRDVFGSAEDPEPPRIVAPKWPADDPEQVRLAEYRALVAEDVQAEMVRCFDPEHAAWAEVVCGLMSGGAGSAGAEVESDPRSSTAHLLLTEGAGRRSVDLATGERAKGDVLAAAVAYLGEVAGLGDDDRSRLTAALAGRHVHRVIGGRDGSGGPLLTLYHM